MAVAVVLPFPLAFGDFALALGDLFGGLVGDGGEDGPGGLAVLLGMDVHDGDGQVVRRVGDGERAVEMDLLALAVVVEDVVGGLAVEGEAAGLVVLHGGEPRGGEGVLADDGEEDLGGLGVDGLEEELHEILGGELPDDGDADLGLGEAEGSRRLRGVVLGLGLAVVVAVVLIVVVLAAASAAVGEGVHGEEGVSGKRGVPGGEDGVGDQDGQRENHADQGAADAAALLLFPLLLDGVEVVADIAVLRAAAEDGVGLVHGAMLGKGGCLGLPCARRKKAGEG